MLGWVVVTAALVFAVVVPVISIVKYYSPKKNSLLYNALCATATVCTWPMGPIILAMRNRDRLLMSCFWSAFLVMAVSGWYWCVLNVQTIIRIQEQLLK